MINFLKARDHIIIFKQGDVAVRVAIRVCATNYLCCNTTDNKQVLGI